MSKKKATEHSPATIALYDNLISTIPGIYRKGDTIPYTSLNGHMFSYLGKDGNFALRLPKETLSEFLTKYNTKLQEAYGIVQKEYAVVPDTLFGNTKELKKYFSLSYQYVKSLKPKPTTKPHKKK
jgi:hypothetical protein